MAAPATTARQTPVGIPYTDPFPTTIAFANDPNVSFWEKSLTPPTIDGGDGINITTMHNSLWRTMHPRTLLTLSEVTLVASYDERCYSQIATLCNTNGSITIHFPDLATLDFWGYLRVWAPSENAEGGDQPTASITILPTNYDTTNDVEAAPVLTAAAGT